MDASQTVSIAQLKEEEEAYRIRKEGRKNQKKRTASVVEPVTRPAKVAKKSSNKNKEIKSDGSETDVSDDAGDCYNSEDEAMRLAIRASVLKADVDNEEESDASF